MGKSTVGTTGEASVPSESSSPLLGVASDLKITVREQIADLLLSHVNLASFLKLARIAADDIEPGLEAALWQMGANSIDNYSNVHPNDSYWNHYSALAYFARCLSVGGVQGLTNCVYTIVMDRNLSNALKKFVVAAAAGAMWQPLADVFPLNNADATLGEICGNTFLVGFGTAITISLGNWLLSIKPEDMPVFTSAMGAVGFSLAYPMPAPEPPGYRGIEGASMCTAAGTIIGDALSRLGMFCYQRAKTAWHSRKQPEVQPENHHEITPKNP